MDYKAPVESYSGKVREVTVGKGEKAVRIGGENILPLHLFEGKLANTPKIALEISDRVPSDWSDSVIEPYKDVVSNPVDWAKKALDFGADMICIRLINIEPEGGISAAERAARIVKQVVDGTGAAVVVYGPGDEGRDVEILSRIAEVCDGYNLLLGPVVKENYEAISKAALDHGHNIIAQTPLDINLEKELNVKLMKTFPPDRIVIDTLSSALGYGMEYTFTIMERTKQIGIVFGDATMQMPMIADLGGECWRTKQARDNREQGMLWEAVTATSLLLAGANLLILRHPDNCRLMKEVIDGKF
jgi:acetyl-CoA decarbonylase/synthase, CODH/ACS complex subunit delta